MAEQDAMMERKDSVPDDNINPEINEVSVDGLMLELDNEERDHDLLFETDQNSSNNRSVTRISRPRLPKHSLAIMKRWLYNHRYHAYPTNEDKAELSLSTGLTLAQVTYWFVNARRRLLPRMIKFEGRNPDHFRITRHRDSSRSSSTSTGDPDPITESPTVDVVNNKSGTELNGQMVDKEHESDKRLVNNISERGSNGQMVDKKQECDSNWMLSLQLSIIKNTRGSKVKKRPAGMETDSETASGKSKQAKI